MARISLRSAYMLLLAAGGAVLGLAASMLYNTILPQGTAQESASQTNKSIALEQCTEQGTKEEIYFVSCGGLF